MNSAAVLRAVRLRAARAAPVSLDAPGALFLIVPAPVVVAQGVYYWRR
ncbi:MAG TPA: hypothetical protein VKB20_10135 [Steroidobacteraceae bacterium]|nr:hypothetical protein [Steroidobacteraceae bacterium]